MAVLLHCAMPICLTIGCPDLALLAHEVCQFLRGHRTRVVAKLFDLVDELRPRQHRSQIAIDLLHDVRWRALRRHQDRPARRREARQWFRPPSACWDSSAVAATDVIASSLTSPAATMPATGAIVCIIIGTRPAMTSFERLRRARIMDHVQVGAAPVAEPLDGQVLQAAAGAGNGVQSARLLLGQRDQFGHRIDAELVRGEQRIGLLGDEPDRHELVHIERQIVSEPPAAPRTPSRPPETACSRRPRRPRVARAAMSPPAPAWLTTMACCPHICDSGSAISRAITSSELPAAVCTMILTGRAGKSSARAMRASRNERRCQDDLRREQSEHVHCRGTLRRFPSHLDHSSPREDRPDRPIRSANLCGSLYRRSACRNSSGPTN